MSRRRRREGGAGREPRPPRRDPEPGGAPRRPPDKLPFAAQVGLLVAAFAVSVGLAELLGAANLGVSFGIGQIVFAIVLVVLLLRA